MKNNKKSSLKTNLSSFIAESFKTIDPGTDYLHNWHIDLIAEYLKAAYNGELKRLIINVPPRSLKSVSVSAAFPAWVLGNNPAERIIVASYSYVLSLRHSGDSRLIVNSPWYRDLFPKFQLSQTQNEKRKFSTTQNGFRFATSVGGTLTGEGGNFLIVDDPHNPLQVMSEKYRRRTLDWFDTTFSTRLNDKKKGVIIVVMQRLHENDLTGYLLDKGGNYWEHLSLPAIADKRQIIHFGSINEIREKGELLHPAREDWEEINRAKIELGSFAFAAQYQQNPISITGGMIEPAWFMRYKDKDKFPLITLSFDTAIKAGNKNDPTVCTVWGELESNYYLLDVYREWLEYPELKKRAIQLSKSWKPQAVLIEDKASGQSLIQDLKKETSLSIIPIKVTKDKVTRFASVSALIEAGRVYLPLEASWLADFESEIYNFPNGEHDDQVDSLSQFLFWAKSRKVVKRGDRYRIRGMG